jgi:hypothetical protein
MHDPALWLYVRDLDVRTYLLSDGQAFQWVQQRRDPTTGERLKTPGVGSPAAVRLGPEVQNNIYYAVQAAEKATPPSKRDLETARKWVDHLKAGLIRKVTGETKNYIWREAAEDVFRDYLKGHQDPRPIIYCVMGHTHVPDKHEMDVNGKHCIYFNSGTWTGAGDGEEDRAYATYLDVREDGKIWMQDWIHDPYLED